MSRRQISSHRHKMRCFSVALLLVSFTALRLSCRAAGPSVWYFSRAFWRKLQPPIVLGNKLAASLVQVPQALQMLDQNLQRDKKVQRLDSMEIQVGLSRSKSSLWHELSATHDRFYKTCLICGFVRLICATIWLTKSSRTFYCLTEQTVRFLYH